jgi:ubiquinone biosynthesis protein UbiJ
VDPLQTALRPLTALLNRQIRSKSPARILCRELDGRSFAIRVRDSSLCAYLRVGAGEITMSGEYHQEPEVVITGSLLSLLRLSRSGSEELIRDGEIELLGDAQIAEQFQKLLKFARPDPEEELSRFVGDVAAHGMGELARSAGRWGLEAASTLRQNVSEYLQEESRVLPSRYEVDRFRQRVEALRDDVARFEARLRRIEQHFVPRDGG